MTVDEIMDLIGLDDEEKNEEIKNALEHDYQHFEQDMASAKAKIDELTAQNADLDRKYQETAARNYELMTAVTSDTGKDTVDDLDYSVPTEIPSIKDFIVYD